MLARRHLLGTGTSFACMACCPVALRAQVFPISATASGRKRPVAPVCGADKEALSALVTEPLTQRSGIRELDNNIAAELDLLQRLFDVTPEFTFIDSPTAGIARTGRLDDVERSIIAMNIKGIHEERRRYPSSWQSSIIGILAHEFAHAFQHAAIADSERVWETHADFLAGWYMGTKVLMGLSALDVDTFADFLFRRGSQTGFFDEFGYGPPHVRVASMRAGARTATKDFEPGRLSDIRLAAGDGYDYALSVVK